MQEPRALRENSRGSDPVLTRSQPWQTDPWHTNAVRDTRKQYERIFYIPENTGARTQGQVICQEYFYNAPMGSEDYTGLSACIQVIKI